MIGILIIAHETFGDSLIACASHMLGSQPKQLEALSVRSDDDPEELLDKAHAIVKRINTGDGVLVLSDMVGGTPCNIATKLVGISNAEGLSGLNLPMLIVALSNRELPIAYCVEKTIASGRESIIHFTEIGSVQHD
jgi:PTS system ascorbate-specific IIA component